MQYLPFGQSDDVVNYGTRFRVLFSSKNASINSLANDDVGQFGTISNIRISVDLLEQLIDLLNFMIVDILNLQ